MTYSTEAKKLANCVMFYKTMQAAVKAIRELGYETPKLNSKSEVLADFLRSVGASETEATPLLDSLCDSLEAMCEPDCVEPEVKPTQVKSDSFINYARSFKPKDNWQSFKLYLMFLLGYSTYLVRVTQ